jgi:hypothetical protein
MTTLERTLRLRWTRASTLTIAAGVLAAVYAGFLLADFTAVVHGIYANADVVSAPVIGELYHEAPAGTTVTLGFLPWYGTLWLELATRHLPLHRDLWEVGPWIASLAGIGLIAWATAKAAGRWSAWFVVFVLVCAGPQILRVQFAFAGLHGQAVFTVCVLDAFLVLLVARRGFVGSRPTHLFLCALVTVVAAAGLASDNLVYPAGLIPFAVAGLAPFAARSLAGRQVALTTLAVTVASVIGSRVAVGEMRARHFYAADKAITFARWDELGTNVRNFTQALAALFNADFAGASIHARSLLAFATACALAAAVVVVVRLGRDQLRRVGSGGGAPVSVRDVHVSFWLTAAVLPGAAFVFSNAAQGGATRYFVSTAYAIVVLVAVAAAKRQWFRNAALVGACLVVVGSIVSLEKRELVTAGNYPTRSFATFLHTLTDGSGAKVGYASYWVAAPLTWETKTDVRVYPVLPCKAPHGLCTYPLHVIASWYMPRAQTKSFLIVDSRYGPPDPGKRLGGYESAVTYAQYTVYTYNYDIATNLGDWKSYGADAS